MERSRTATVHCPSRRPEPGMRAGARPRLAWQVLSEDSLHGAGGQAPDDVALDEDREYESRDDGHHSHGGSLVELDRTLDREQARGSDRDRLVVGVVDDVQADEELVPGEDHAKGGGDEHA